MPRVRIFPYKNSPNLSNIRDLAGMLSLYPEGTKFKPRAGDTIINWGRSSFPEGFLAEGVTVINSPEAVSVATSKLKTLTKLKEAGVNVPHFTTGRSVAAGWLARGKTVLARSLDRSFGGRGIQICDDGDDLPQAGLYTLYRPKQHEFRVHVWNGRILDLQQKKRRRDFTGTPNFKVRTWDSGWVYCREGINVPEAVGNVGLQAVQALGLYFGAVDIGWSVRNNEATCYEVNTAPGCEGTTAQKYSQVFAALQV